MTIKELRDMVYAKYSLDCQQRGKKEIRIADKMLSFFISAAQQDIQRRLSIVESSTTITLGTSSNLYALPQTFGKQKHAYVGGNRLEEKPIVWAEQANLDSSRGFWYAIKIQGHTPYIYCPVQTGTLTIVYYPDLSYYQPSVSASQVWGTFDGVTYSGNLLLPDRYNMAILYHVMSQFFPDYLSLYEKELKSLRESRQFSDSDKLGYNLGGLEEDTLDRGYIEITSTSTITVNAMDEPIKRLRIKATDTGSYNIEYSYGWEVVPTVVNIITDPPSITISSANNEFTNYLQLRINNLNFGYTQSGANTITITPDPTSGWGEVEIIVEIFD